MKVFEDWWLNNHGSYSGKQDAMIAWEGALKWALTNVDKHCCFVKCFVHKAIEKELEDE